MDNEKEELTDDRLDELLASVSIPQDLQEKLMSIPEEDENAVIPDASARLFMTSDSGLSWARLAVAACYLLLAGSVIVFWPADKRQIAEQTNSEKTSANEIENKSGSKKVVLKNEKRENSAYDQSTADTELAALSQSTTLAAIEEKLAELKVQSLEKRLTQLENKNIELGDRETVSLILAVADQTSHQLGGSKRSVNEDMQFVIQNYPSSRGAEIAVQVTMSGN